MTRWCAIIAEDFTFANVARVAQATADFWKSECSRKNSEVFGRALKAVVGYDRRFFSDRFAKITASHNPPIFNGFKLKSHFGGSSSLEECKAVEKLLDATAPKQIANQKSGGHPSRSLRGD